MNSVQKVATFLFMIGLEKGRKTMDLMDSDEVKNILSAFSKLPELSPTIQERIWQEFVQLGYGAELSPVETLYVLRQLFNGSKISDKENKRFF